MVMCRLRERVKYGKYFLFFMSDVTSNGKEALQKRGFQRNCQTGFRQNPSQPFRNLVLILTREGPRTPDNIVLMIL